MIVRPSQSVNNLHVGTHEGIATPSTSVSSLTNSPASF